MNNEKYNLHFKMHKITIIHFLLKFSFIILIWLLLLIVCYFYNENMQIHKYILVPSTLFVMHIAFSSLILNYINYFNSLVIVSNDKIMIINSTLFFQDDIQVIDISKITKLNVIKQWLFTNIFNYWKICIEQQKDESTNLLFVPDPYNIIWQIERKQIYGKRIS